MSEELYTLCEVLTKEIRNLINKNDINPTELERLYKAVDIIKDIKTIEAMEDYGTSNMYPYSYDNGMSYTRAGMIDHNGSYRRGRDSMGRYASRDDGYSRHDDKEHMLQQIEMLKSKVEQM